MPSFLPRTCELCRGWSATSLCPACVTRFGALRPRCPCCALPAPEQRVCGACLREPPPYVVAIAALDYGFPWDRLITAFKFHDRPELAGALAECLRRALDERAEPRVDWVLPVPLGPGRLAERGYNQAWELARRLASSLQLRAEPDWLLRSRETPHQVGLSRRERERNLRDAIWVDPARADALRGRTVALVDDVMTTGVTAAAAARALLAAGAGAVRLWVLARTPAPDADRQ